MNAPGRSAVAFWGLSRGDRRLAFRSAYLLASATVCVHLLPLKKLIQAIDDRVARRGPQAGAPEDALRLCAAAARRMRPRPTCLVTALAGYELLRERGWQVALVIGGQTKPADFRAHAWLERDDVVVFGAPTGDYQAIWRWSAGSAVQSERDASSDDKAFER